MHYTSWLEATKIEDLALTILTELWQASTIGAIGEKIRKYSKHDQRGNNVQRAPSSKSRCPGWIPSRVHVEELKLSKGSPIHFGRSLLTDGQLQWYYYPEVPSSFQGTASWSGKWHRAERPALSCGWLGRREKKKRSRVPRHEPSKSPLVTWACQINLGEDNHLRAFES